MEIERIVADEMSRYVVWNESKSCIIGGATIRDSSRPVHLKKIDVQRNLRGNGIGSKLLKRILSDYENSEIVAEVFSSRVDWYRRHGFDSEEEVENIVKVCRNPQ